MLIKNTINRIPCQGCLIGRINGHSRCVYCGAAIPQGREPSERERYETSQEARDDRELQIAEARRSPEEIDDIVQAALSGHIDPTSEFTHDHLVQYTGLNNCALKFSLQRLQARGVVKHTGEEWIRSNRSRPKWQYLLRVIGENKTTSNETLDSQSTVTA
jgi:hypothetical protein